jgi:hypothetical protein
MVMFVAMWLSMRKRRWRDWKWLAKASTMPPRYIPPEPRTVRDLAVGEQSYVHSSAVVTSKKRRQVFVAWDANLQSEPDDPSFRLSPLLIRRLERGFAIAVRPGDEFRTSSLPWGEYAPVIEIVQAGPSNALK